MPYAERLARMTPAQREAQRAYNREYMTRRRDDAFECLREAQRDTLRHQSAQLQRSRQRAEEATSA